ncbi:MAG: Phenylacetic acid catabolic protein [Alphaproteobacteria bacterium]
MNDWEIAMIAHKSEPVIYLEGDPGLPKGLRDLLVNILTKHLENTTNPHYIDLLNRLWDRSLRLAPNENIKVQHAKLCQQEVEHGVYNANILSGLGVGPINTPIQQYLLGMSIDTWVDLNFMHALGDRYGMYLGEVWENVPYEPLRRIAGRLHKEEVFHCNLGMSNLKNVCATSDGKAEVQERLAVWWPAALDMFGKSTSKLSAEYVKWGIRSKGNEELRQEYIRDTRPILEEMGLTVPDDRANRRFL